MYQPNVFFTSEKSGAFPPPIVERTMFEHVRAVRIWRCREFYYDCGWKTHHVSLDGRKNGRPHQPSPGRFPIVDFDGMKGFSARQIQSVLGRLWPALRTARIAFPGQPGELDPERLALALEMPATRDRLSAAVIPLLNDAKALGFPAIFGIDHTTAVLADLQRKIGIPGSQMHFGPVEIANNGGAYTVPAFSGLFAPYRRSDARGVIAGLTRFVNKGHIARAVLEASAYQSFEIVEAMNHDSGVALKKLKVDGGMVANEYLMQFQAGILNVPVILPAVTETTALGAAYAAGLAVDYWSSAEELRRNWRIDKTREPEMGAAEREAAIAKWKKAVSRTFDWVD